MKNYIGFLRNSSFRFFEFPLEWLKPFLDHFKFANAHRLNFSSLIHQQESEPHENATVIQCGQLLISRSDDLIDGVSSNEIVLRSIEGSAIVLHRLDACRLGLRLSEIFNDEFCSVFDINLDFLTLEILINFVIYREMSLVSISDIQRLILLLDELEADFQFECFSQWICSVYSMKELVALIGYLNDREFLNYAEILLEDFIKYFDLSVSMRDTFYILTRDISIKKLRLSFDLINNDRDVEAFLWCAGRQKVITHLSLANVNLQPSHLSLLAHLPAFSRLEELDLSYTGIGDAGCRELSKGQSFGWLNSLLLRGAGISDEGLGLLANTYNFITTQWLDLANNHLSDIGCRTLIASPMFAALRHLDLSFNVIESDGVKFLCNSSKIENLQTLILDGNRINCEGIIYLSGVRWKSLVSLGLRSCWIKDRGLLALSNCTGLNALRDLGLWDNDISYEAVKDFIASTSFPSLKTLQLGSFFRPITVKDCLENEWGLPLLDYVQLTRHDTPQQYLESHYPQMLQRAHIWLGVQLDTNGFVNWSPLNLKVA